MGTEQVGVATVCGVNGHDQINIQPSHIFAQTKDETRVSLHVLLPAPKTQLYRSSPFPFVTRNSALIALIPRVKSSLIGLLLHVGRQIVVCVVQMHKCPIDVWNTLQYVL